MQMSDLLTDADNKMKRTLEAMKREMGTVRTGRASPSLVENVGVDYYGSTTPLNQLATITAPEARLIVVQPWDRQALPAIEKGISKANLGLNPSSDGSLVRIPIPQLTEERRKEFGRIVRNQAEVFKVEVRSIRRDAVDKLRNLEKNKDISQDENHRSQEQIQRLTDSCIKQVEEFAQSKEAELMEV